LGQKTNPIGIRLGITRSWKSLWYDEKNFSKKLEEDLMLRKYIRNRLPNAGVSQIEVKRTPKRITLTIHTARPGIVIGKKGSEVDKLKEELQRLTSQEIQVNIHEIKGRIPLHTLRADIDYAQTVANTTYGTIGVKVWICKGEIIGA